jgi:zinc transporter 1/2/3
MSAFNPTNIDLTTASKADVFCYYATGDNEYNGHLGARISSIFVIGAVSTAFTYFPVIARKKPSWKIPKGVYTFSRFFGSGVIVATAFIHLLDPAYKRIGPRTCVGESGFWSEYSWCAAIVLGSIMAVFLIDLCAEVYVERKYGVQQEGDVTDVFVRPDESNAIPSHASPVEAELGNPKREKNNAAMDMSYSSVADSVKDQLSFHQQIGAFLVLEFGIIFHSVIIGLNLGVVGSEFATLYPVLVFHQSFEGLGIGARLSTIPFPNGKKWMPWVLCAMYGLTTPISIAIGLGIRYSYEPKSKSSLIIQGCLNAVSAGFLVYSGLVELLARDFLFDPDRTKSRGRLLLMVSYVLLGAGIMALIGWWA